MRTNAIVGANVLVGENLTILRDATVVIVAGRIAALGPRAEVAVPEGAAEIDASGHTLVPGFIDAHVHIGFFEPEQVLRGGVTTARDLGWPPELIHPLARRSRSPDFNGPRIVAAGPMLTVSGGYPLGARWAPEGTGRVVDGAGAAARAVEITAQEGAAVIKVALNPDAGPTLGLSTLTAIVEAAHRLDLKVTGHVGGVDELIKALDAGVDELAHMLMTAESIPDEVITRMVAHDMVVVPTLSIFSGRALELAIDNLARFREAGGTIVYGTDLGNAGPGPGIDRLEVTRMAAARMSVHEIVATATVRAARHLGLQGTGSIAENHRADLVLIDKAPLVEARDLTTVLRVWRG